MIDIHAHALPGIDDGPSTVADALALAAHAAADGVRTIVATPHVHPDFPLVRPDELAGRVAAMRRELAAAGVAVDLHAGGEVDLLWANDAAPGALQLVSYGQRGRDLLVETPYGELAPTFEDALFRIAVTGYRIVLAHPERSAAFQRDPARLAAIGDRGVLLQVTANALVRDDRRSRSARLARALVKDGIAHVIASDRHGPHQPARAPLSAAVAVAERLAPGRGRWMVEDAPRAILGGSPLPRPPAIERGGWRRALRRAAPPSP